MSHEQNFNRYTHGRAMLLFFFFQRVRLIIDNDDKKKKPIIINIVKTRGIQIELR